MNKNEIIETAKNMAKEASIKYVLLPVMIPNRPSSKATKSKTCNTCASSLEISVSLAHATSNFRPSILFFPLQKS